MVILVILVVFGIVNGVFGLLRDEPRPLRKNSAVVSALVYLVIALGYATYLAISGKL